MPSPRAHGFTLIEIIVSVSLLLVLSSLFMASYSGFNNSQTVKQAASTLVVNLSAVRTKASAGVKPTECITTLTGYIVDFTDDEYTAQALCEDDPAGDVTTYKLPTGVLFTPVPSSITFYVLDRGASVDQTIVLTGFGTTVGVHVSPSGLVSNEGSMSAPLGGPMQTRDADVDAYADDVTWCSNTDTDVKSKADTDTDVTAVDGASDTYTDTFEVLIYEETTRSNIS